MPDITKVSIVTATLNASKNIHRLRDSIQKQTNIDLEWIVIDGGSTDNTIEIVNSSPFAVTTEILGGSSIYEALNRGIERSTGEWIIFMGADDQFYDSNALSNCLSIKNYCRVVLARVKNINRNSSKVPEFYSQNWDDSMLWRNTIHHQGIFYHRTCFKEHKFDTAYKVLADYHFNLRLYLSGIRACQSEGLLTLSDASGISKNFNRALYKEELRLKNELLKGWKRWLNYPWVIMKFLYKSN